MTLYAVAVGAIVLLVFAAYLLAEGITPAEALRRALRSRPRNK